MAPPEMALHPEFAPTFLEKLDLIPAQLSVIGAALYAAMTGPFRGDWGADTYFHHVTHSAIRKAVTRMNTAQLQYLAPPYHTHYQNLYCKVRKVEPDIVTLKSGCKGYWIGEKKAKNICIYFHSGGFAIDGSDEHVNYVSNLEQDLIAANKSVAFLCINYSIAPFATYPTQFREGVEALDYVLNDLGRSPSDTLLLGDSAGGNMCLMILSHLIHPSPEVPELKIATKLKAAVLVSPWVSFTTEGPSVQRNLWKDPITPPLLRTWSSAYMAGHPTSPYAEPLEAPASWWEGVQVEQTLCVAGADEILLDGIKQWVEKYKSVNPDTTTFVVGKNECHVAPIIEPKLGDSKETEQGRAITSFLKARL